MEVITGLSLILVIVFIISSVLRRMRQPMLIAYVVAGIIAAHVVDIPENYLSLMSEIGISFLLFIVGIHLSPKSLKSMGMRVIAISAIQMGMTFLVSYSVLSMLVQPPLVVSVAMAFSSTIIAMKILSDRNELSSLHGRMAVGILIMQDVAALSVLLFLSSSGMAAGDVLVSLLVVSLISAILWHLISRLDTFIARSRELLFLFSVSWLFAISTLFRYFRLSPEMGALIAGMLLSNSEYRHEISARVKPLRDFFIIMFFIVVGSKIGVSGDMASFAVLVASMVAITLAVKPAVVYASMRAMGYLHRPSLLAALSLSQLSEFSIILLGLASSSGLASAQELSAVSLAAVATMAVTPYLMSLGERIRTGGSRGGKVSRPYDAILFGCNRIGHIILKSLRGRVLVVDFDPEVVKAVKGRAEVMYGDASDEEFLEEIRVSEARMVISTIPDFETNLLILSKSGKDALRIVVSYDIEDAMEFYRHGASLVLMPHFLGGEYVASIIERHGFDMERYERERLRHMKMLEEKKRLGHRHPGRS